MKSNNSYISHQAVPVGKFFIFLSIIALSITLLLFFLIKVFIYKIVAIFCGGIFFVILFYLGLRAIFFKYIITSDGISKEELKKGNFFNTQVQFINWGELNYNIEPYKKTFHYNIL